MKPLLILLRTTFVGIFWSIFFIEGIRVIMLTNWRFDIFSKRHWNLAWELWLSGWVIKDPKEWAFVLIILTFIPLWFTGWAALSMIPWGKWLRKIVFLPLGIINRVFAKPVTVIKNTASVKAVKKKKSYKEVRPRPLRMPLEEAIYAKDSVPDSSKSERPNISNNIPQPIPPIGIPMPKIEAPKVTDKFDHSLFQFDDSDDDFDFNFDAFEDKPKAPDPKPAPAPTPLPSETGNRDRKENNKRDKNKNKNDNRDNKDKNNRNVAAQPKPTENKPRVTNSTFDVLKQKGFEIITGAAIKDTLVDFIGISSNQIYLCLLDKESGDWLADEERFNDEEPLWFSESSHRISPVRKIDLARQALISKLADSNLEYEVKASVIIQIGNIINAEDMLEIWNNMNISVTRIDRGSPKELKLFSKYVEDADPPISKENFEKLKKLIRNSA